MGTLALTIRDKKAGSLVTRANSPPAMIFYHNNAPHTGSLQVTNFALAPDRLEKEARRSHRHCAPGVKSSFLYVIYSMRAPAYLEIELKKAKPRGTHGKQLRRGTGEPRRFQIETEVPVPKNLQIRILHPLPIAQVPQGVLRGRLPPSANPWSQLC